MATKRRRGAAKRTYARQEAARKRDAAGKRFIGETAAQSARDRQRQRKRVVRMARAAREAKRAEAARTAGVARPSAPGGRESTARPPAAPSPESGQSDATFRAAEERAAAAGAEIEPLERPLESTPRLALPGAEEPQAPAADQPDGGAIAIGAEGSPWGEPSVDVSADHGASPTDGAPALGSAVRDLLRSAFRLARTVASVPFRIALAIPRAAVRAVLHA